MKTPIKNNREKLRQEILKHPHPLLMEEMNYFLYQYEDTEEGYDIVDAFDDALDLAEEYNDRKLLNLMRDILFNCGYIEEVDIEKIVVSSGKKYWFKKNGKYYDVKESFQSWLENETS